MKRCILFCLLFVSAINIKAQCWQSVAADGGNSAGIKTDGSLWTWGNNQNGQLGDGTLINRYIPTRIGIATNWQTVAVESGHSAGIRNNGTLWTWGANGLGQLGIGTLISNTTPVQVPSVMSWQSVDVGRDHTMAIKADGTLWGWGGNSSGQLGDGTTANKLLPVQIGTATDWQSVSAGGWYTLAIKTNGTLWAWGLDNNLGRLGLGPSQALRVMPIQIGTATDWKSVCAGFYFVIATKTNGTLWSWGENNSGDLGNGTYINTNVPLQAGTATDWNLQSLSIAIKTNNTLWTWGNNAFGQLGNGTFTAASGGLTVPAQMGSASNWMMAVGNGHHLAIKADGTLWGWGFNIYGQVGDGSTLTASYVLLPVEILSGNTTAISSSSAVCAGSSVTLTGSGATTYTWAGGVSNGVSFVPVSSGVYTVTGTDAIGCYNSATVAITVIPNATITAHATATSICAGSIVTLAGSGGGGSYTWSGGVMNGAWFTPTSTATYTVSNSAACSNTDSIMVSVLPSPLVSVNHATICAGTNALLTASVNPVSATTYNWSQASTSSSLTVSPAVNTSYTVTATNSGCSSSAVASVSVIPVIVPVTGFSYPTPLCITASNPLPTGVGGFSPGGTYSSGTGITTDPASGLVDLSNSIAGTYVVTYSVAANGCNPQGSSTATVTLNAPTLAVTGFSYLPVCSNDANPSPFLNPNFTTGGNFSGSGLALNAGTGVVDLSNTTAGTYTITYNVNAANCVLAGSGTATVVINPTPLLSLSSSTLIYAGDQTTLIANSSTNIYTWFPAVGLTCSDCASPVASPNESTTYCVRTTDGICTNSACVTVIIESLCEGDKGFFLPNAFSPNGDGNNDVFCVQGRNRCVTNFQMIVYDRWGEKVFESSDLSFCWDGTYMGKTLGPDVFVYYIKARDQNHKELIKKGNISLIK